MISKTSKKVAKLMSHTKQEMTCWFESLSEGRMQAKLEAKNAVTESLR